MKIETLMWLLPAFFIIHDFEEIIMVRPWMTRNAPQLQKRFPRLASRFMPHLQKLSTSAFALAVAEEFILLTFITYLAVELNLYELWAGITIGFFIHLLVHAVQFGVYRSYIPAVVTSVPAGVYCLGALYVLNIHLNLSYSKVIVWALASVFAIIVNVIFAHWLAAKYQRYLDNIENRKIDNPKH